MRIELIAVGTKPPRWVREGFQAYSERLGRGWRLRLTEVPAGAGRGSSNDRASAEYETQRLLRAVPPDRPCVVFDERGAALSTQQWAEHFERWRHQGGEVAMLIGGADGLGCAAHARADACWSLSPLTLPHMLVRLLVAEQVYRAWTLLSGHPYHRA
ncbi:23S rRNA (pseudouridine(1915)-N(3))-methyltransferase RlmH [Halorhodospira abdelmalekii]|uniref:23S rRNA (pseudouridine(1915)-N(3))-methyltransferase RlmH n=1 Tax=Halorhodospira abdelmalekii TaxID=421629 RepID=UPI00190551C8|nr:23S rRNA (pseudouridine(1915)-N(3))-methyltransferase RlmH [Halorhodospira abdelmalekii]